MRRTIGVAAVAAVLVISAVATLGPLAGASPGGADARAVLRNASGTTLGLVRLTQLPNGVIVSVRAKGLAPGFHGFHVHANNDPANGVGCVADPNMPSSTWFVSADGHYREAAETHPNHQADMPVILINGTSPADSRGVARFRTDRFDVSDVVGRVIVVHALPDNYANVPLGANGDQYAANSTAATDKTAATGNAGDRILCGVIEP